jgi:hypothetical protein
MSGKMFLKPELPENFASSDDEEVCTGHALGFPVRSELGLSICIDATPSTANRNLPRAC